MLRPIRPVHELNSSWSTSREKKGSQPRAHDIERKPLPLFIHSSRTGHVWVSNKLRATFSLVSERNTSSRFQGKNRSDGACSNIASRGRVVGPKKTVAFLPEAEAKHAIGPLSSLETPQGLPPYEPHNLLDSFPKRV